MKTKNEDNAAMLSLAGNAAIRHFRNAETDIDKMASSPEVADRAKGLLTQISAGPHEPGPGEMVICLLTRGAPRTGTVGDHCHDCHAPVDRMPNLPYWLIKLCVFCACDRLGT